MSPGPGELKKTVEIVITDDTEPEDDESLMIGLVNTEGGSRILPSSDTVTVVIGANDDVAGRVGFHPASRSLVAREGGRHGCSCTEGFTFSPLPCHLRGASLNGEWGGESTLSSGPGEQVGTEAPGVKHA